MKELEGDVVRSSILKTGKRIDGRDTKLCALSSQKWACCHAHMVQPFSHVVKHRRLLLPLWAQARMSKSLMRLMVNIVHALCCIIISHHSQWVKQAVLAHQVAVRLVMVNWRRAINPLLPSKDEFPYTMRVVSEVTESNGSSSMATVCGTSLALMDAGVPLQRPVAGIAMGLIKEGDEFAVLSDILGDEDHLGDMDFKVAGSESGITSLQMDIKITSITAEIMQIALEQAKGGRLYILGEMAKALTSARDALAESAPKITTISIPVDKIRDIIGPGGKIIREICEETGAKIDIEDDGTVKIAAVSQSSSDAAYNKIRSIVAEPELGVIYDGKVVKTVDFGAFVNFLGPKDGLVHISEMMEGRVEKTTDVCNEGDMVKVKVIGFDDRGKVKLSMKRVNQETGEDLEANAE